MKLRRLCFLCVLCASAVNAFSLDREAFTFTNYDLNVRVETEQQRLGVRGKITLRNDSATPQKIAVLQISSSLDWRSITAGGKPLQFISQPYTSDIDHTGALSEAIVTLPDPLPPRGNVDLEIAYEGVIVLDATRLTRIATPEAAANSTDWDQISPKFTAVRGAGYVTWYPIATESANLSEGTLLFDILARWKAREISSTMRLQVAVSSDEEADKPELLVNATTCPTAYEAQHQFVADCTYRSLGSVVPAFVIANYELVDRAAITVHFLRGHDLSAANYADAAEKLVPFIAEWFGTPRGKAQTADLADANAAPFESGPLLLTSLTSTEPKLAGLSAAHQLTHAAFLSSRPWINEGLAHFAQALYLEHQSGRQAALDYIGLHRSAFSAIGKDNDKEKDKDKDKRTSAPSSEDDTSQSLVNTNAEELYRSKAMCVWWMLRDMIGDPALKKALAAYHPEQDKEPSYMPHLIQAQTQNNLEWFFDDWVYRDRGLPDFKVASKRLVVRGKSDGVIRVEVPKLPEEIVINDGSVPESDVKNNVFKIEADAAAN